ncbi:MAG: hypothetical protein ACI8X5_003019 [Planctomycetota bacterium]|jgi:hypothetical protein
MQFSNINSSAKVLAILVILSPAAIAFFTNAVTPGFRGTPGTQFAGWEDFTSAFAGPNSPDDVATTASAATLVQNVPGAIITGGNIYQPSGAPNFTLSDSAPSDVQEVVFQISTRGEELIYTNTVLSYMDGAGVVINVPYDTYTQLAYNPGMGVDVESMYTWDLALDPEQILDYEIYFEGFAAHVSLDALILDTRYSSGTGLAFCFGDGTGTVCPCGNAGGPGRGCANGSSANGALLDATGSALVSNGDLVLHGHGLPAGVPGLFFRGSDQVNSGMGNPFGDGLLCAGSSIARLEVRSADSFGEVSSTVNIAATSGASAGTSYYYQLWYRDTAGACGVGFNTTNGLAVAWE